MIMKRDEDICFLAPRAGNYNNNDNAGLGYLNMNNDVTNTNAFRSAFRFGLRSLKQLIVP